MPILVTDIESLLVGCFAIWWRHLQKQAGWQAQQVVLGEADQALTQEK